MHDGFFSSPDLDLQYGLEQRERGAMRRIQALRARLAELRGDPVRAYPAPDSPKDRWVEGL